ncbi:hypothetical protein [Massilia luteola]|uniref:hypothetical protein n=1 Tax=Massilia luteola TaxID=3081751 RepID=UPI002ACC00D0|nr:hypothetical protein [Massilia sp. Gc5]
MPAVSLHHAAWPRFIESFMFAGQINLPEDADFECLLAQVMAWWPDELAGDADAGARQSSVVRHYEASIAPRAIQSASMLLVQLDWVLFGIVVDLSRKVSRVRVKDIRPQLIKDRFHALLTNIALPQLLGEKQWDGSFERDELVNYLRVEDMAVLSQ